MSPDLFILTLGLYLFCIVVSLLFAIFYKKIPITICFGVFTIHILAGIGYLIFERVSSNSIGFSTFFTTFFCCGVLTSGLFIRQLKFKLIKYYSFIYLASILLFLFSPSKMVGFIATGDYNYYQPVRFHVYENFYFIEAMSLMDDASNGNSYKIIREMGMYHRTIKRNIDIPFSVNKVLLKEYIQDSILIIKVIPNDPGLNELVVNADLRSVKRTSKITKGKN